MYRRILLNKRLPFKKRIKRLILYYFARISPYIGWKKRFHTIFKLNPDYNKRVDKSFEKYHVEKWKPFRYKVNLKTLRLCENISGITDINMVPEEIYVSDIEPTLNQISSVNYLAIKSFYNRWFTKGLFPIDYFHNLQGEFFGPDLNRISQFQLNTILGKLSYPVVYKPTIGWIGGREVYFPETSEELLEIIKKRKNYVVQEKINQHPFFSVFNKNGLNTIRVCVYRSVKDNSYHILNSSLRMGKGGSLDNMTDGGIVSYIKTDGLMHGYALDKYGKKFIYHPDTLQTFDKTIPEYDSLKSVSINIAKQIFFARLVSLDMCMDEKGKWRAIEINLAGQTIRFSQYAGHPFFGQFTDEVIDFCLNKHWAFQ